MIRSGVAEAEFARDEEEARTKTIDDIEMSEKNKKLDMKDKETNSAIESLRRFKAEGNVFTPGSTETQTLSQVAGQGRVLLSVF